jgi:hypothetical protein
MLTIADEPIAEGEELIFSSFGKLESWEYGTGAWYLMETYKNERVGLRMWLCDVTKHQQVFGYFPTTIYFKKA